MTRYANLIAKLEAAPEGSPKLDVMIAEELDWTFMSPWALSEAYWIAPDDSQHEMPPPWSTSLDTALTLVPEDPANPGKPMLWSLYYDEDGVAGERSYTAGLGKGYHDPDYIYGHNDKSPALALCIAALKARTVEEGEG